MKKFKQHDVRSAPMKHSQDHLFEFVDFRDLNAFLMDKFLEVDKTKSVKSSVLLDKTLFQKFMNTPLEQVASTFFFY